MFQKLLVCTDGSPYSDVACQYGFLLATALKAQLTGLHILDIRMVEGPLLADISGALGAAGYFGGFPQFKNLMEAKGQAVRKSFVDLAQKAGVDADFKIESGHPVHAILEHEEAADLLILGQRGENEQFGRELTGSVADRITRRASKPCLVTPGQFTPVHSIMAACDGSPISNRVAVVASSLAKALGAELILLTVEEKLTHEEAEMSSETASQTCRKEGCIPTKRIIPGHATEVILDSIVREKIDLIVMGAHAHTRMRQWFVGCTSQRVLADSGIPALLVR